MGNAIGTYFIEKARQDMQRWFINLPYDGLSYFSEDNEHFDEYFKAVEWP